MDDSDKKISSACKIHLIRATANIKAVSEIFLLEIPEHRVIRGYISIKRMKVLRFPLIMS